MHAQLLSHVQLFATPMNYSPPGSSVHEIFQTRTLEWVAISSSRGSSPPRDQTPVSCIGRQILYHRATREALIYINIVQNEIGMKQRHFPGGPALKTALPLQGVLVQSLVRELRS